MSGQWLSNGFQYFLVFLITIFIIFASEEKRNSTKSFLFWNYNFLHKCQYRCFGASLTQCQVWIYCPLNQWVKCGFCFNILKLLLSCNVEKLVCQKRPNLGASFTQCRTGSCSLQSCNQSDNHWSIVSPHYVDFETWKKNLRLVKFFLFIWTIEK